MSNTELFRGTSINHGECCELMIDGLCIQYEIVLEGLRMTLHEIVEIINDKLWDRGIHYFINDEGCLIETKYTREDDIYFTEVTTVNSNTKQITSIINIH